MNKRHDIEFEVGQLVTFNAYGIPCKGIVKIADAPPLNFHNDFEERIFYYLDGPDVVSKCTGKCIEESKYFEKPEVDIIPGQCTRIRA